MVVFCWENIIFYYKWVLPDEEELSPYVCVFMQNFSVLELESLKQTKFLSFKFALFLDRSINHG